jgi:hypothetical protein
MVLLPSILILKEAISGIEAFSVSVCPVWAIVTSNVIKTRAVIVTTLKSGIMMIESCGFNYW